MTLSRPAAGGTLPGSGTDRETHVRRPAQEQRANLQGPPGNDSGIRERGLREKHHRPETDLKRSPG